MVQVGTSPVVDYEYDGLNRRIAKTIYSGMSVDHCLHSYYNEDWENKAIMGMSRLAEAS